MTHLTQRNFFGLQFDWHGLAVSTSSRGNHCFRACPWIERHYFFIFLCPWYLSDYFWCLGQLFGLFFRHLWSDPSSRWNYLGCHFRWFPQLWFLSLRSWRASWELLQKLVSLRLPTGVPGLSSVYHSVTWLVSLRAKHSNIILAWSNSFSISSSCLMRLDFAKNLVYHWK